MAKIQDDLLRKLEGMADSIEQGDVPTLSEAGAMQQALTYLKRSFEDIPGELGQRLAGNLESALKGRFNRQSADSLYPILPKYIKVLDEIRSILGKEGKLSESRLTLEKLVQAVGNLLKRADTVDLYEQMLKVQADPKNYYEAEPTEEQEEEVKRYFSEMYRMPETEHLFAEQGDFNFKALAHLVVHNPKVNDRFLGLAQYRLSKKLQEELGRLTKTNVRLAGDINKLKEKLAVRLSAQRDVSEQDFAAAYKTSETEDLFADDHLNSADNSRKQEAYEQLAAKIMEKPKLLTKFLDYDRKTDADKRKMEDALEARTEEVHKEQKRCCEAERRLFLVCNALYKDREMYRLAEEAKADRAQKDYNAAAEKLRKAALIIKSGSGSDAKLTTDDYLVYSDLGFTLFAIAYKLPDTSPDKKALLIEAGDACRACLECAGLDEKTKKKNRHNTNNIYELLAGMADDGKERQKYEQLMKQYPDPFKTEQDISQLGLKRLD
jgi:hypothetical protein